MKNKIETEKEIEKLQKQLILQKAIAESGYKDTFEAMMIFYGRESYIRILREELNRLTTH
jgi:hypothetical protein